MLFERRLRDGIRDGSITLAFRRWARRQVTPGGRYRMGDGGLADVVSVEVVDEINPADAPAAGYPDLAALLEDLRGEGPIHRLSLRLVNEPDPRDILAESAELTPDDLAALDRLGSWALVTLELIAANPGVRAADLAPQVRLELQPFKLNVRKLKNLGLTISLGTGYRISPRGEAYLSARLNR
ncbi:hypothetical protein [Nonomuraea sp. NPDC046570]|uniref:hypothetical protein n=1 Tax=Nonomuraea sp. NPDC046570 TaxID=3155255 RepID=UPI0033CA8E68